MIIDGSGEPVWSQPLGDPKLDAFNFEVQEYRGEAVLNWWVVHHGGYGRGEYVEAELAYNELARVRAGNGYAGDHHAFLITPEDTTLFTVYNEAPMDLSPFGGPVDAMVLDGIAQEADIETGEVLFEWRSLLRCLEDGIVGKGRFTVRWFETCVVVASVLDVVAIIPLRDAVATVSGILLLPTLVLFSTPGVTMVRYFFDECFSGFALAPAAFVTSVGLFALAAVPMLAADSTLDAYLWVCGTIIAASLLAVVNMAFRIEHEGAEERGFTISERGWIIWTPFAGLVGTMAYITSTTAHNIFGDICTYLSWVREYLDGEWLASVEPFFGSDVGLSRAKINDWLLEQAASRGCPGLTPSTWPSTI